MRIVQVLHYFLPRHLAGTEIYTYNLSSELSKRHKVYIYCREDGFFQREFHEADEAYRGLPVRRVYFNLMGQKANPINQFLVTFKNKIIERSFTRFLEQVKPDVVHIQHLYRLSASLISIAKKKGIPVVVTLHDYWFICHAIRLLRPNLEVCSGPLLGLKCAGCVELGLPPWVSILLRPLITLLCIYRTAYVKNCLEEADLLISPSSFLKNKFVEHGFAPDHILVSDNGTNTALFQDLRRESSEKLRFGYIGTIQRHKGVHVLIEAFNKIDDSRTELKIFGDPLLVPNYYTELRDMAQNPRIQFLGEFDNSDIGRILSEIDVLIVPSIWPENSPLTIHEASLAEVPVIASNFGGMPELVENGVTGFLFKPGDADELYSKMHLFIENRELVKQFQDNIGPIKSIEENAQELERIYKRLIARRR